MRNLLTRLFGAATILVAASLPLQAEQLDFRRVLTAAQRAENPAAVLRLLDSGRLDAEFGADQLTLARAIALRRMGRFNESERLLRGLLNNDPSRRLVRFELAQTLAYARRFTAARFQVDRLLDTERDVKLRQVYRAFVAQILRERPWDFNLSLDVAPSSNINGGSTQDAVNAGGRSFVINPSSRAKSGVGVTVRAEAKRRFVLPNEATASLYSRLTTTAYSDDNYNRYIAESGVSYRDDMDNGHRIITSAGVGIETSNKGLTKDFVTGRLSYHVPVGRSLVLMAHAALTYDIAESTSANDGVYGRLIGEAVHSFNPGFLIGASAGYTFDRRGISAFNFDGVYGSIYLYRELGYGITANVGADIEHRRYLGPFPLTGTVREDLEWSVSATLTKRDWAIAGFAPQVRASYSVQNSNVAFYENDAASVSVGLTRAF